jgi:LPPG:FO 2-phospho-L-lactate transferase
MIAALAGGVGAAKFLQGLVKVLPEEEITVIVNTGDDIKLHGLHISPDIDIIIYTLAGVVDESKGWGIRNDTFNCLGMLQKLGCETWFKLGDMDLGTHIFRTSLLKSGLTLSEVVKKLCLNFGVKSSILPMTDDEFETRIKIEEGTVHFQEYLVKREAKDKVLGVVFEGVDKARPAPGVIPAILNSEAVIICPSNPIVSIGTILSLTGVRDALKETKARVIAVSPIVGAAPVKGPADKLMRSLGLEVSAYSVAYLYRDFLDIFVIDLVDRAERDRIEGLGLRTVVTNTLMKNLDDKVQLARVVLDEVRKCS